MTPRIGRVEAPDAEQQAALAKTPHRPDGEPLNVFSTLAHHPALLRRVNALGGAFPRHAALPTRARELVTLRVAARVGSDYVAHQHRAVGARAGLTRAELDAAGDPETAHPWSAMDAALLAVADELLATHALRDATWVGLDGHLDTDAERLELVLLVGFYALMGALANATGIELDEPYVPVVT